MRAPDVTVGAAPRGFKDRLVGAMDAEVITGATEAIEEPTDMNKQLAMCVLEHLLIIVNVS